MGVAVGTLAAMVIGALIVKLRGIYFAMVTIAFGQVFYFLAFTIIVANMFIFFTPLGTQHRFSSSGGEERVAGEG